MKQLKTNQLHFIPIDESIEIKTVFSPQNRITLYHGDCLEFMNTIPDNSIQLIVTSPPCNIGKPYEKRLKLEEYLKQQTAVIKEWSS